MILNFCSLKSALGKQLVEFFFLQVYGPVEVKKNIKSKCTIFLMRTEQARPIKFHYCNFITILWRPSPSSELTNVRAIKGYVLIYFFHSTFPFFLFENTNLSNQTCERFILAGGIAESEPLRGSITKVVFNA